jgi:hypothetical protein
MIGNKRVLLLGFIILFALLALTCAPGNERWGQNFHPGAKAGFWVGLWHGLIVIVTFIISLFDRRVGIYEINNIGWPYNLGFILGLMISLGGGLRAGTRRHGKWDYRRLEDSVREGVRSGIKDSEKDKDWEDINRKIDERVKEILRDFKS